MQKFNESFYTDDFDQEMLDFLLHNGYAVTGACKDMKPDLDNNYLNFSISIGHFWTDNLSNIFSEQLTKNQFKERIGMTKENSCEKQSKPFTKEDLKSGEHVVKLNDGSYLLVLGNKLVDYSGWYNLNAFYEDLSHKQHSVEVENIYTTTEYFALEDLSEGKELTLIWERESPEQKEKRLQKEKLKLKLQELQKECKIVENEIMKLGD